jgi:hypothetical protein
VVIVREAAGSQSSPQRHCSRPPCAWRGPTSGLPRRNWPLGVVRCRTHTGRHCGACGSRICRSSSAARRAPRPVGITPMSPGCRLVPNDIPHPVGRVARLAVRRRSLTGRTPRGCQRVSITRCQLARRSMTRCACGPSTDVP